MNTTPESRLLEIYDRVAEAPDAIERLRKFVLDLAVRGKLVEQDPEDEPAEELLERIADEKERLVKTGAIRKPRAAPALDPEDIAYPAPEGWAWSQLAQIGLISPRNEADDDLDASFVPMPMISAELGVPHLDEVRPWSEIKKGYTHFAEGDVGLAKITPCFENGKSTVFRDLTGGIGAGTTELHIVRPILINADYILLFLKSPQFIETGIPRMTGTAGQKRVPKEYFTSSPFPLPPLPEQHRIVAKVDELMTLLDRLETTRTQRETTRDRLTTASLTRLTAPDTTEKDFPGHARFALDNLNQLTSRPDQIKVLRQTILNLAVRGKLVEQDPGDEPPDMQELNEEEIPENLPTGWRYSRLADLLAENTRNGYSRRPDDAVEGVPILRISAGTLRQDGLVAEEEHKLISGIDEPTRRQYGLQHGDLLACRFNGNKAFVGRLTLFADHLGINPIYPDKLIRVRLNTALAVPEFVRLAGESDLVRERIEAFCSTTVGNWGISASNLKQVPFPIPPIAEQQRIVAQVNVLMAICDQLEAATNAAYATRARLLEVLLHKSLTQDAQNREAA